MTIDFKKLPKSDEQNPEKLNSAKSFVEKKGKFVFVENFPGFYFKPFGSSEWYVYEPKKEILGDNSSLASGDDLV